MTKGEASYILKEEQGVCHTVALPFTFLAFLVGTRPHGSIPLCLIVNQKRFRPLTPYPKILRVRFSQRIEESLPKNPRISPQKEQESVPKNRGALNRFSPEPPERNQRRTELVRVCLAPRRRISPQGERESDRFGDDPWKEMALG